MVLDSLVNYCKLPIQPHSLHFFAQTLPLSKGAEGVIHDAVFFIQVGLLLEQDTCYKFDL